MIPRPAPAPTFYHVVSDFLAKFLPLLLSLTAICALIAVLSHAIGRQRRELEALGNALAALAEGVNSTKIQVNVLRAHIARGVRPRQEELAIERDAPVAARDEGDDRPRPGSQDL
jgi:hypothetical protein